MTKEEKKSKHVLTDNHKITIKKREVSLEGLMESMECGPDSFYNLIANDKNILFTPKISITLKDLEEIPALRDLRAAIEQVEKAFKKAQGRDRFLLKKQLIEMYQDQYVIKNAHRRPINILNLCKTFSSLDLSEKITVNKNGEPETTCLISFFNPKHISALLCHYSALKEQSYGEFSSDNYFLMQAFDDLVYLALAEKYPLYYDLVIYKIDGMANAEIRLKLSEKYNITYTTEYLSSLWRNKIPKLIAETAKVEALYWYYTEVKKGRWKKCSRCGQIKLANNMFFSKNKASKDGLYSICKECRNKKNKE